MNFSNKSDSRKPWNRPWKNAATCHNSPKCDKFPLHCTIVNVLPFIIQTVNPYMIQFITFCHKRWDFSSQCNNTVSRLLKEMIKSFNILKMQAIKLPPSFVITVMCDQWNVQRIVNKVRHFRSYTIKECFVTCLQNKVTVRAYSKCISVQQAK